VNAASAAILRPIPSSCFRVEPPEAKSVVALNRDHVYESIDAPVAASRNAIRNYRAMEKIQARILPNLVLRGKSAHVSNRVRISAIWNQFWPGIRTHAACARARYTRA